MVDETETDQRESEMSDEKGSDWTQEDQELAESERRARRVWMNPRQRAEVEETELGLSPLVDENSLLRDLITVRIEQSVPGGKVVSTLQIDGRLLRMAVSPEDMVLNQFRGRWRDHVETVRRCREAKEVSPT